MQSIGIQVTEDDIKRLSNRDLLYQIVRLSQMPIYDYRDPIKTLLERTEMLREAERRMRNDP